MTSRVREILKPIVIAPSILAADAIFGSVDYAAVITAIRNTARPLATKALL